MLEREIKECSIIDALQRLNRKLSPPTVKQARTHLIEPKQNHCSHVDIAGGHLGVRKVIFDRFEGIVIERRCLEFKILSCSPLCNVGIRSC
jgi:hypothetical protein